MVTRMVSPSPFSWRQGTIAMTSPQHRMEWALCAMALLHILHIAALRGKDALFTSVTVLCIFRKHSTRVYKAGPCAYIEKHASSSTTGTRSPLHSTSELVFPHILTLLTNTILSTALSSIILYAINSP